MKKFIALIAVLLVVSMVSVIAVAEGVDVANLTDDELILLQQEIHREISNRKAAEKNVLVFDQAGVQIYYTGNVSEGWAGYEVELIIANNSNSEICISTDEYYVNGWEVNSFNALGGDLAAGKKKKTTISFKLEDVMASSIQEIEQIEIKMHFYDQKTFMNTYEFDPFVISLNIE